MNKINLQYYSFADYDPANIEKNICLAAEMGFNGLELFGPIFAMDPTELKSILDKNNMEAISLHADAEKIEEMIPFAKTVGTKFIGIGMKYLPDKEAVYAFAKELDRLGAVCKENGLMLTYHNHTQEFLKYDGKTILEIFLENTNPDNFSLELDCGWVAASGNDPFAFIEKYGSRIKLIHIKECDEPIGIMDQMNPALISFGENGPIMPQKMKDDMAKMDATNCAAGKGLVDWAKLVPFAESKGCQAFVVEREASYEGERIDCLKADFEYYKKVLFY